MFTMSCILLSFSSEKDYFYSSTITSSSIYQNNKDIFDQLANEIKSESAYSSLQANAYYSNSDYLKTKEIVFAENDKLNLCGVAYASDSYTISGQQSKVHFVFAMSISYEKKLENNNEKIRFTRAFIELLNVYDSAQPQYVNVNYGQFGIGDNWSISEEKQSFTFERVFDKGWLYEKVANFGVTADVFYTRGYGSEIKSVRFQLNYR